MPAAETELAGVAVLRAAENLTEATWARLQANVVIIPGFAGSILYPQYSKDNGVSWKNLASGSTLQVSIDSAGFKISSWARIVNDAKADVLLRIVGRGGNGALDPAFSAIRLQVR